MTKARRIREQQHLSLNDVAAKLNISPSQLSRFERGEREMAFPKLRALAELYGVTVDELMSEAA